MLLSGYVGRLRGEVLFSIPDDIINLLVLFLDEEKTIEFVLKINNDIVQPRTYVQMLKIPIPIHFKYRYSKTIKYSLQVVGGYGKIDFNFTSNEAFATQIRLCCNETELAFDQYSGNAYLQLSPTQINLFQKLSFYFHVDIVPRPIFSDGFIEYVWNIDTKILKKFILTNRNNNFIISSSKSSPNVLHVYNRPNFRIKYWSYLKLARCASTQGKYRMYIVSYDQLCTNKNPYLYSLEMDFEEMTIRYQGYTHDRCLYQIYPPRYGQIQFTMILTRYIGSLRSIKVRYKRRRTTSQFSMTDGI